MNVFWSSSRSFSVASNSPIASSMHVTMAMYLVRLLFGSQPGYFRMYSSGACHQSFARLRTGMRSVEGEIQEKGPVVMLADEVDRFPAEQIRGVACLRDRLVAAKHRGNAVTFVRPVIDAGIGKPVEEIEAALQRQEAFGPTAVPFAHGPRGITGLPQDLGDE